MGIIKAAIQSVSGGLADQWLEVSEPDDMGAFPKYNYLTALNAVKVWILAIIAAF